MGQSMMVDSCTPPAQLTPAMDIFAAGYFFFSFLWRCCVYSFFLFFRCSLMELFTDGQPPFDFAQLLSYRSHELEMTPVAEKIEDEAIRVIRFLFFSVLMMI